MDGLLSPGPTPSIFYFISNQVFNQMVPWLTKFLVPCKLQLSISLSRAQLNNNKSLSIHSLHSVVLLPSLLSCRPGQAGPQGCPAPTDYQCGGRAGQQGQAVVGPTCDRGREE